MTEMKLGYGNSQEDKIIFTMTENAPPYTALNTL